MAIPHLQLRPYLGRLHIQISFMVSGVFTPYKTHSSWRYRGTVAQLDSLGNVKHGQLPSVLQICGNAAGLQMKIHESVWQVTTSYRGCRYHFSTNWSGQSSLEAAGFPY